MDIDHVGAAHFWLDILVVKQGDGEIGADLGVLHEVGRLLAPGGGGEGKYPCTIGFNTSSGGLKGAWFHKQFQKRNLKYVCFKYICLSNSTFRYQCRYDEVYRDATVHVVSDAANLRRAWVLFEVAFGSARRDAAAGAAGTAGAAAGRAANREGALAEWVGGAMGVGSFVSRLTVSAAAYDRHSVVLSDAQLRGDAGRDSSPSSTSSESLAAESSSSQKPAGGVARGGGGGGVGGGGGFLTPAAEAGWSLLRVAADAWAVVNFVVVAALAALAAGLVTLVISVMFSDIFSDNLDWLVAPVAWVVGFVALTAAFAFSVTCVALYRVGKGMLHYAVGVKRLGSTALPRLFS